MLLTIGQLSKEIGVSIGTIRRWDREGILKPELRTGGRHRRYQLESVLRTLGAPSAPQTEQSQERIVVAYSRVSSSDQKMDLVRQEERRKEHLQAVPGVLFISDLGSGLNFKKRGLAKLLALILAGRVSRLVITHKDRLLRFGFELMEQLIEAHGGRIEILEDVRGQDETELAIDVLTVMTVFSAKLYGRRSHRNRQKAALAA